MNLCLKAEATGAMRWGCYRPSGKPDCGADSVQNPAIFRMARKCNHLKFKGFQCLHTPSHGRVFCFIIIRLLRPVQILVQRLSQTGR